MTLSPPCNSEVFAPWKLLIVETGALPFWWQLALGEEVWQGPLSHSHRCPLGNLTSLKTSSSKKSCPWILTPSPLRWGDGGVLPHRTWTSWSSFLTPHCGEVGPGWIPVSPPPPETVSRKDLSPFSPAFYSVFIFVFYKRTLLLFDNVTVGLTFILNKSWAFLFSSSKRKKELKLDFSPYFIHLVKLATLVENVSTENTKAEIHLYKIVAIKK